MNALPETTADRELRELADRRQEHVRYARCFGLLADDADDVAQEAFAIVAARRSNRSIEALHTYLLGTIRQLCRTRYRTRRLPLAGDVDPDELLTRFAAERSDRLDALEHCLGRLTPRARRLLQLLYEQDAGPQDAGRELGLARNGVKTLLKRTKAALKHCIANRMEQPR